MERRFTNVAQFAASNDNAKNLVEQAIDFAKHKANELYKTNYTVVTMGREGQPVSLTEKAKQINELMLSELQRRSQIKMEDFGTDYNLYAINPMVSSTYGMLNKVLVDAMIPIFVSASGLERLATFHYGGYGDTFEFELTDAGNYAVSKMGRHQKHTKAQEKKKYTKTIATDMYGLTSIIALADILQGNASVAEESARQVLSMTHKIYALVVEKFIEKTDTIIDTKFLLTNYDEKEFLKRLRNGSAYNGEKMTVIGDAVALKDVLPANAQTRILLQDEYNTTVGFLSTFNGFDVMGFDVVRADETASGIVGLPENRVYGMSLANKAIHVAIGQTLPIVDGLHETENGKVRNTLQKEIGVDVATNRKVVVCKLA